MTLDDIPGTRPVKKKQLDFSTRDVLNVNDIEGTRARVRHASRPNAEEVAKYFNPIDYRDVTHCDFKTKRSTNPLSPTYAHRDEDGTLKEIGQVKGSYPCVLPPAR